VEYEYDIFEMHHDDSVLWHARATGMKAGLAKLQELSKKTTSECFDIHLSTQTILARVNQAIEGQTLQDHSRPIRGESPRACAD
jgi:hypothetical protein